MHGSETQWLPVICHGMRGGGSNVTSSRLSLVANWWNDNAPASSHIPYEATLRLPVRQLIRSSALLLAVLLPHRSVAQSTTSLLPDATVLPSRELRFRVLTSWTRYDEFLGTRPGRNIGSILAVDSLGPAQVPSFLPIQTDIRAASGDQNFRLTAGNVVAPANSRVVTAPLIIEYGVMSRLTLGIVVPLVETRTTVITQLNPRNSFGVPLANVGPNPAFLGNTDAQTKNFNVINTLQNATTQLRVADSTCKVNPTGTGCSSLLGQQASIDLLLQNSDALTASLTSLYGTSAEQRGQAYVPLETDPIQIRIDDQINSVASRLSGFLGTSVAPGRLTAAHGPGALKQLNDLFIAAGRDTLEQTVDHTSIGDISMGATLQLLNSFGDTTRNSFFHPQYRLSVNGTFRLGTGQPANRNQAFSIGTGYGQNGITGGVAGDLRLGRRFSGSVVGSYTAQLGTIDMPRVLSTGNLVYPLDSAFNGTYSAGNVAELSVIPRVRLAGYFALTGQYSFLHVGADEYTIEGSGTSTVQPFRPFGIQSYTAHQIGLGFTYSTIVGPDRVPGAIPFEVSYNHLETLAGSGGPVNKTFRDQIELKVYVGTWR